NLKSCSCTGRSSPSDRRVGSICAGVASGPSMTPTGSPGIRGMSRKTTGTTTAITGNNARTRPTREALSLSLLEPHVVEADALGLLVEALHGRPRRAQAEEIAVADHRHLLVELARLLLPQRHALLRIGLAYQLVLEFRDVLVRRPSRPVGRQVDVVGRIVEGSHAGGEDVVLLRV